MKLWQLKNPQTGENIGGLQPLPENWGPIFGMEGVKDRLGDLSWIGITDRCWIEVESPDPVIDQSSAVEVQIKKLLSEAVEMLKNKNLTKQEWQSWDKYYRHLSEMQLQPGYPNELTWPIKPE